MHVVRLFSDFYVAGKSPARILACSARNVPITENPNAILAPGEGHYRRACRSNGQNDESRADGGSNALLGRCLERSSESKWYDKKQRHYEVRLARKDRGLVWENAVRWNVDHAWSGKANFIRAEIIGHRHRYRSGKT